MFLPMKIWVAFPTMIRIVRMKMIRKFSSRNMPSLGRKNLYKMFFIEKMRKFYGKSLEVKKKYVSLQSV